jgi:peptide/nickel transport system substrate-binding protein
VARRIRWQIVATLVCSALILLLLGHLALSTAAQGDPTTGGTYREALVGQVLDLNPLRGASQTRAEADITPLLFEGLTRVETTGVVAPDLAASWEISPDETIYTVTLRPDVRWHDGAPFTSADVVWTTEWLVDAAFNGDPALAAPWQNVAVIALDEHTLRFALPTAFAPFLSQLALPILPAHLLKDASTAQWSAWSQAPIGTGPYKLQSLQPAVVELVANADYTTSAGLTPPNLRTVAFRLYPSLEEAHMALRRGAVDALAYDVTALPELPLPKDYLRSRAPLADYTVLTFNLRETPLDDERIRQAISYAIDKNALISTALAGRALPLQTPILPSSWAWADDLTPYVDDANHSRAAGLFNDSGWQTIEAGVRTKAGQPLHFGLITSDSPERLAVAKTLQAQLLTVGISTTIEPLSAADLQSRLNQHDFELALHGWSNLGSDPDVYELWHSSQVNAANFAGLADPTLDELLVKGRQTNDLETRRQIYREFQSHWLTLAPSVVLYEPLLEQQVAPTIKVLGLTSDAAESEVLYHPSDRFRRLTNWYEITTRQVLPNLRPNNANPRPR